jgi:hypothetical protein
MKEVGRDDIERQGPLWIEMLGKHPHRSDLASVDRR